MVYLLDDENQNYRHYTNLEGFDPYAIAQLLQPQDPLFWQLYKYAPSEFVHDRIHTAVTRSTLDDQLYHMY
jgi:hypothetical protein